MSGISGNGFVQLGLDIAAGKKENDGPGIYFTS
jgi:hypothetical protein